MGIWRETWERRTQDNVSLCGTPGKKGVYFKRAPQEIPKVFNSIQRKF